MAARVAVFASGGGTNLQALVDHFHVQADPCVHVELVIASRPQIGALRRADAAGIPTRVLDAALAAQGALPEEMLGALASHRIDLIVLAGYLQLVPAEVTERFRERILNIHPALLPAFGGKGMYGMRVHRAVIEAGVRVSGASVHLVDEQYDRGRILAQWPVPVLREDTPETLAARVLRVEHRLLPRALEAVVSGRDPRRRAESLAFDLVSADAPDPESLDSLLL